MIYYYPRSETYLIDKFRVWLRSVFAMTVYAVSAAFFLLLIFGMLP